MGIYFESRLAKLKLNAEELPFIDDEVDARSRWMITATDQEPDRASFNAERRRDQLPDVGVPHTRIVVFRRAVAM